MMLRHLSIATAAALSAAGSLAVAAPPAGDGTLTVCSTPPTATTAWTASPR